MHHVLQSCILLGVVHFPELGLQALSGYKIEYNREPFKIRKARGIDFVVVEETELIELEVQKMPGKFAI